MSSNGLWSLDEEDGVEKAYCCLYTNARDLARIGQMMLDSGKLNGVQILSESLVQEVKKNVVLKDGSSVDHYGLQWWKIEYRSKSITYARGILGQYIICIPEINTVIVRLGHRRGDKDEKNHPKDVYHYIDLAFDMAIQ